MTWTKSSWADVIGTNASKQTVNAGATASGDVDCNGANPYMVLGIKVVVVFGASPDGALTINIYRKDADGANEQDTVVGFSAQIVEVTSSEERFTFEISVLATDTVTIEVENEDTTDSVDVWVSAMGGYQ